MFLHINNTMAILLKTASVRVSTIQIMQVRVQNKGKSVWKSRYDGDVSRPPSSFFPPSGGELLSSFSSSLSSRRRSEYHCGRTSCPKLLCGGGHSGPPWPSSPAPGRAPEPASLSEAELLVPRTAEPDTESTLPSLSSPGKINSEV